jgi:hypothetical protein
VLRAVVLRAFMWRTMSPLSNRIVRPATASVNRHKVLRSSGPILHFIRPSAYTLRSESFRLEVHVPAAPVGQRHALPIP